MSENALPLTLAAEVGSAAGEDDALDGLAADAAGHSLAGVDAMLQLEKAFDAVGIDVIGDGGAAERDGVGEDLLERDAEAFKLRARERVGDAAGTNAGAKEAFVGVDVADAVEQGLIEQSGFDGDFAALKEARKIISVDGHRLTARSAEGWVFAQVEEFEPTESAGVNETDLAGIAQCEPGVGVRNDGLVGVGDDEPTGHAEVDDPLVRGGRIARGRLGGEVADDVFADSPDGQEPGAGESCLLPLRRGFHRFGIAAEPCVDDLGVVDAFVDAAGDGFDFGQFGHRLIVWAAGVGRQRVAGSLLLKIAFARAM